MKSGAPDIERGKAMSALTANERVEFVRAVETRMSGILTDTRIYSNMCRVSGAMAGLVHSASGENAEQTMNLCEDVTEGCSAGVSAMASAEIAINTNAETFNCEAGVNEVLGCLEESVRVMEGFRDAAGMISCTSPKSSLENLVRTIERLRPGYSAV